ncbi:DUF2849 domain-containing protein [Alsobacter sp. R-9]
MMKKPRSATLLVVSANDTLSGVAIYRTADGWTTRLDEALVIPSQAEAEALLPQVTRASAIEAVDPYLVEVIREDGRLVPVRWRERIRLEGPTVPSLADAPVAPKADAA